MSGQLPNTSVSSSSGMIPYWQEEEQQLRTSGNYQISGKMQIPDFNCRNMDPELVKIRRYMSERIYEYILQRTRIELSQKKAFEIVKRLEESLFKTYGRTDEYANLATLENRIRGILIRKGSHNQHHSHVNSSSLIGTMIPTPGLPQSESSVKATSNVDNSMVVGSSNPGASLMVTSGNSFPSINRLGDEALSNGYQHLPSSFSTGAIRNMGMGVERVPAQMIPTPGFSSAVSDSMEDISNSPSCSSNNVTSFSNADSVILSQPLQQKPPAGGHNPRISHNLVSRAAGRIRPSLPQSSYGASNGSLNAGVGMIGNNMKLLNGAGAIEGQPPTTMQGGHPEQLDQHQRILLQGDSYEMSTGDNTGSANLYFPATSVNADKLQSMTNTNSSRSPKQSNLHTAQPAKNLKQESADPLERLSYPCENSSPQYLVQTHQHQQFQQQPLQKPQKELQYQHQGSLPLQNHSSRHMQQMGHQQQFRADMESEWYSESKDLSKTPVNFLGEQNVCQERSQGITALVDETQKNKTPEKASVNVKSIATRLEEPSNVSCSDSRAGDLEVRYKKQQRWILFLRHARRCPEPVGKCREPNCVEVQNLLTHMGQCSISECSYAHCHESKGLIYHYKNCRDSSCPVCVPVKNNIAMQLKAYSHSGSRLLPSNLACEPSKPYSIGEGACVLAGANGPGPDDNSVNLEPSVKRLKIVQSSLCTESDIGTSRVAVYNSIEPHVLQETQPAEQCFDINMPVNHENTEVKMEFLGAEEGSSETTVVKQLKMDDYCIHRPDINTNMLNNPTVLATQENIKVEKDVNELKHDNISMPTENGSTIKSEKPKIKGVSLTELFTPDQVREHVRGLRQWVGQSKAKAEKNRALEHSMSENSCQLCAVEKLAFEPPLIYCSPCGARIKRNAMYYTIGARDTRHYFCVLCYNDSRGDTILIDGSNIPKARMEKKKNDEETEEGWVQCDKCEAWQHQICALFNGRRNDDGQAEYTCPNCYIEEVEGGERMPLLHSAVLGAKDLPKTVLSDHIEKRLAQKLKQERQDRAKFHGKGYDEVPGVDDLVVRVVSSVDKKLEVKPRFLEIFKKENYPSEFQYKSKVLLLFQKIEGVEVCLFGMYVQEFGSECQQPNHRRVYLSYLDSVKYFRPEVKTISGEALRTYVYHEILIGYLEYCKLRGFTSCYIWACPPLKGEDYILYCHPEIQKTPKSDKLREWYLSMLRKATRENIVTELTNLHDHFLVTTGECRANVTAARLPYFDGDYWPGAAEDMVHQLQQEEEMREQDKKGTSKKNITKRAFKGVKSSYQTDLPGNVSKDLLLMRKLGETISAMKEDFIMVHLQHACSHCCILMVCGNRWVCNICPKFQLCDSCYEAEKKREDRDWHPINEKDKHQLHPVVIDDVPEDTKDEDEILESEFFDTRQAFLSLCQGNHYQYDTLRRAKHSSMMVLYHLHNPTAPAYVSTCNACHLDIDAGQGWRCETCPDFDVCNACYGKGWGINHPHKLTNHPSMADRDAQNKEARQLRVTQLKKMLELLVHASRCRSVLCEYRNCRKVKGLFRHGIQCKVRAAGGCRLCIRMWHLLQLHARACKESECDVPRCRDLKDHLKRQQQQSDSRRRAAVMEMMRQRAAEVAGNRLSR